MSSTENGKNNEGKSETLRFIIIYVLSGLVFYALTMPFHKLFEVFTVTEVRPSAVLYPFLGISFGWPSALGIMTANLISDIKNGYNAFTVIVGMFLQVLYVMVPRWIWNRVTAGEEHRHRLDSVKHVIHYVLICYAFAMLSGAGVGMFVYVLYGVDWLKAGFFTFLNNFDFAVILGCPLMIISNQIISRRRGTDRTISLNEWIIIVTACVQAMGTAVLSFILFTKGTTLGTYDNWNTIYICAIILVNVTMILSLLSMIASERTD